MPVVIEEMTVEPAAEPPRGGSQRSERDVSDTLTTACAEEIQRTLRMRAERLERLRAD